MKTIDLKHEQASVDDLLRLAAGDSLLIRNREGVEFLLETADFFDREVAELSRSERFMSFLAEQAREPGTASLEEIDRRVSQAEAARAEPS